MENIDIIALLLTIIAFFIAIFIFKRVLIWVALVIIIAVIGYFILQNNGNIGSANHIPISNSDRKNNFQYLEQFKNHYCDLLYDKDDSLMCTLVITPIYQDIIHNYAKEELAKMNKKQFTEILIKTTFKHKNQIIKSLKKQKALYLWEDFTTDLKNKAFY